MEHYNANASMLPNAGGSIEPMRGGGAPVGYNPDVSVIQLPPTANSIPIVDMKGGDETLPMAAAATVVTAATGSSAESSSKTVKLPTAKPSGKAIRFILFDEEFDEFSTTPNEANKPILALLSGMTSAEQQTALQEIYDGIINLRKDTNVLVTYPHFKRLLIRMGINYAKKQNELKEDPNDLEKIDIKLALTDKGATVTLTIPCDQLASCRQKNLSMAAAATVMLQKGGDESRTITLFGTDYIFPKRPDDINSHLDLLKELEVGDKDTTFKIALLGEIYDGCYTDGPIISRRGCTTIGELLETLGEKYAKTMQDMMRRTDRSQKKDKSITQKVLPNGDLEFTFTFSNFGKQIDAEDQKKINAAVQKSTNAQSIGSKLKHMVSTVSSDQVSTHGMINRNNACFCISVLQFLFSIPQIRTAVKKHGCDSEVLAQILHPDHKITTVNNDGIMCALFNLFEELGENIKTFSTVTSADLDPKNAVPYELLGYIMKNFEVSNTSPGYTIGNQDDAYAFLTFLFPIFAKKKIPIEQLFEFTTKSTRGDTTKEQKSTLWLLQLERDASNNLVLTGKKPKQVFGESLSSHVSNVPSDEDTRVDTIKLEKNPYVLMRTSINSLGDGVLDGSGIYIQGQRYNNIDLDAITPELTIDGKKFKLFGSIQYNGYSVSVNSNDITKGTDMRGHYIYTRRDLASKKGIIYNDSTLTLDDDIGKGSNQFPHYLLVYAEVGSAESSTKVESDASDAAVAPEKDENEEEDENAEEYKNADDDVKPASAADLTSIEEQLKPASESKSESSVSPVLTELLSKKIEERLKAAQTVKKQKVDSADMIRIKKAFDIPESEADKNKIMNAILGNIDMWMKSIPKGTDDYNTAYLNYITFLVLKSKIDAQLHRDAFRYKGEISHAPSKTIARDLIEHYDDIPTASRHHSIEYLAEHIIEPLNFELLQVAMKKAGGRRTLRAKKRILRASKQIPKKRTLRASKKLRQLLNST
jgi:hypothetical protein